MENKPKREPTRQERWRARNAVKMRAYQRDLMRVRRAAAKVAEGARNVAATMPHDAIGADER